MTKNFNKKRLNIPSTRGQWPGWLSHCAVACVMLLTFILRLVWNRPRFSPWFGSELLGLTSPWAKYCCHTFISAILVKKIINSSAINTNTPAASGGKYLLLFIILNLTNPYPDHLRLITSSDGFRWCQLEISHWLLLSWWTGQTSCLWCRQTGWPTSVLWLSFFSGEVSILTYNI